MLPFSLSFGFPWAFVALGLLLVLPRSKAWPWRFAALALLITALAQPSVDQPDRRVAVLVDVSESVGERSLAALEAFDLSRLSPAPTLIHFAGEASIAPPGAAQRTPAQQLNPEGTDIARALQVAAASEVGRVLLLSDGIETNGDALAALPEVPVDTFDVGTVANTRLVSVLVPDEVTPGETVEAVAVVESDRETLLTLRPVVGGEALEPVRRTVPAGQTPVSFTFRAERAQDVTLDVSFEVDYDQPTVDDRQSVEMTVSEQPPILVLNDPAVAELLRTQGFGVVEGAAEDVRSPMAYSAVVLRESARQFTPGQLELLASFVEQGGGLLMTGGPDSFGLGEWFRTPVEAVLPVNTDLRTDLELPLVAMVIILDRSMSMTAGRPSRIALAQQGAIDVVELAYEQDLIGLVVFSDRSEWTFRPRQATQEGKEAMLRDILAIEPTGGTIFAPAYEEALAALRDEDAAIKHIIVLSDGEFYDGRGPFSSRSEGVPNFPRMAARGFEDGITTSTIAIGEASPEQLEGIARAGGGRFYASADLTSLPQIFTSEALIATRALLREETVAPGLRQHPLILGLPPPPPVDAYVATTLKQGGELLFTGQDDEPLLAVSRQGLGRTAALTTDLNAWAGELGRWPQLGSVVGTLTRWLQTTPAEYAATVAGDGDSLRVVVDAVRGGAYINDQVLEARYGDARAPLQQVAPGRYEGRLEAAAAGGQLMVVHDDQVVARSAVSAPNPEFDRTGADRLLRDIAQQSGGQVLSEAGAYTPPASLASTPIWPLLALLGFVLFVMELLVRRFASSRGRQDQVAAGDIG